MPSLIFSASTGWLSTPAMVSPGGGELLLDIAQRGGVLLAADLAERAGHADDGVVHPHLSGELQLARVARAEELGKLDAGSGRSFGGGRRNSGREAGCGER